MTASIGLANQLRLDGVQSTNLTKVLDRRTTYYTASMRGYDFDG